MGDLALSALVQGSLWAESCAKYHSIDSWHNPSNIMSGGSYFEVT